MRHASPLPSVELRIPYGPPTNWVISIDGHPIRKVKSVKVAVEAVSGLPTVTIEMWADVTVIGDAQVDLVREHRIAHCHRPHSDETAMPDLQGRMAASAPPEAASGDFEALPEVLRR